jgi:hypothetical protein
MSGYFLVQLEQRGSVAVTQHGTKLIAHTESPRVRCVPADFQHEAAVWSELDVRSRPVVLPAPPNTVAEAEACWPGSVRRFLPLAESTCEAAIRVAKFEL